MNVTLFVTENLSPFHQRLPWKCRELRRAGKIYSAFSSKFILKIQCTMNELPFSIKHGKDLTSLYPDFVFKEKQNKKRCSRKSLVKQGQCVKSKACQIVLVTVYQY